MLMEMQRSQRREDFSTSFSAFASNRQGIVCHGDSLRGTEPSFRATALTRKSYGPEPQRAWVREVQGMTGQGCKTGMKLLLLNSPDIYLWGLLRGHCLLPEIGSLVPRSQRPSNLIKDLEGSGPEPLHFSMPHPHSSQQEPRLYPNSFPCQECPLHVTPPTFPPPSSSSSSRVLSR